MTRLPVASPCEAMWRLFRRRLCACASSQSGPATDDPAVAISSPAVDQTCRAVARDAHKHYQAAAAVLAKGPKGQLRAPRLMGAVYSSILSKMEKQGWAPPRTRAKIGKSELLMIVLRHVLSR